MTNEFDQKHDGQAQGFENIAFEREAPIENTLKKQQNQGLTNVIQTVDFIEQYKDMVTYEDAEKEFNELKTSFRAENASAAQMAENRGKNRYMNVVPNDLSRVKLNQDNDYINANFVNLKVDHEYIATQGPLPGTKEDFWTMVWQENVRTVVMLTQLVENGKIKCDQYWPFDEAKEPAARGLEIEKIEEHVNPLWTERTFYLLNENESRKVKQFQLTSWVNSDVPASMLDFVTFIRHVRSEAASVGGSQGEGAPFVVHCSDGGLKTGLFIAIDKVLGDLKNESFVDILGMVYKMKQARQVLVSSENQYKLIYETVRDYLNGKFNEPDIVSNGKPFSSNEYLNEDPADAQKRNAYFNPALVDDSSSDSSSSLTDSEDEAPVTMKPMKPHPNAAQIIDDSSSDSMEPF